ncbi:unnamed protein product [Miscanthus lutarioriparius]|uniref:Uncharacterized protein n=1 Tax=Miscanthus lutarioriparius TaxID=422564 RepID=A0A811RQE0_9POAL|nr:unnamed protein product [Miscanthus lutarioriparius]
MELVAGAMGSLLPKLGELLKEEYGLQKGVKKKIESLSRELTVVHAVLRKIGDVPPDQLDELVRLWASEVREASYDMEDIVDTFLVRVEDPNEATEPHMLRRLRKKVGRLFKKSKARRKISSLIDDINEKLEEVATRRGRYTLDNIVASPVAANTIDPRILNLYKRATELVGIEGPRDELINMLSLGDGDVDLSSTTKMKILSVVGSGGLGKTTLAKAVYDHLKPRFECRAFVPVGQNPDVKKVFGDILIALDEQTYTRPKLTGLDENQLMGKLNEFVKEKRYLIVIDDIWDKKTWKLVRCALQESNCGSRLVITTRISEVAAYADEPYKIQPLSHDNSEKLLYARIVDSEGKYFDSLSAETCERILKKCGGVPLAIITLASLLASKPGEDWSEVYNSIGFGHKGNDDVDNTRRILSFSYYDLPSHLKACLLYLSVFPEDSIIEKNSLIWMWIAEGFISEEQGADAGGKIFVTVLNGGERQKLQGSISRRLALQCVEEHNVGQLANIAVEKVRSIFASECDFCALCPRLPYLRVVEMVGCSVFHEDCIEDVSENHLVSLLHLRYLRLENIKKLPEVGYLRFLQTLDLRDNYMKELPEEVGLLTQLVCLRCSYLTRVPAGLIGKLTSLQELCISCGGEGAIIMQFVKELGLLRELRVLQANIRARVSESIGSALLDSLGHLHNIQELEILVYYSPNKVWVSSDAGRFSCRHLRVLRLHCFGFSGLPVWINSSLAPNLCYLDLLVVAVEDHDMETLAKLPELSCLILHLTGTKLVSIKLRAEGVGYFRKLRSLKILGSFIRFDVCGGECNSSRVPSNNTIMPGLESLEFGVHVRSLKDEKLQLGFDKMLGFQNLGTSSLQRVKAEVNCQGATIWNVKEAEAALKHAAAVHPKHPTLLTNRVESQYMIEISRYQKACMEMSKAPELVTKAWKLADIVGSGQIQILRMPDPTASSSKVMRLLYTDNGLALLALSSNDVHKLWKWEHRDKNPRGKSSKFVPPVLWQPKNGIPMTNDTIDGNDPKEATACTALSKKDHYLISASGGKVSLFNMMTFKVMTTFMAPPPAATFLAIYPFDNNIIAIGREDSSIQIYNVRIGEVKIVLTGHHKKITGLAFSQSMDMLVSSGADAQLCVWSIDGWEKKKSRYIKRPSNGSSALVGDTVVQFHYDGRHLLVVHESQLAIYDWQLECLCSWFPRDAPPSPISSAVYSLGCLLVYAGFRDGAIGIFDVESLTLKCRIAPSAYIPSSISRDGETVYPTVVARHPWKPNQIVVGMSDGAVLVLEPLDTDDVQVGWDVTSEQHPSRDVSSTRLS